jgi:ribosomal-protein-serine acetyltransferase
LAIRFDLPNGCHLRLYEESDVDELARLVTANREHLAAWMPWAAEARGPEQQREFIQHTLQQVGEDNGFQTAIVDGRAIVGGIGFHRIDRVNRATSLGYWIAAASQGRGTVTEAVRALTTHAFHVWDLNRVEIRAAVGNTRSAAIPLRLGYVQEGVLRQAERYAGGYRDLLVFSMLAGDWAR